MRLDVRDEVERIVVIRPKSEGRVRVREIYHDDLDDDDDEVRVRILRGDDDDDERGPRRRRRRVSKRLRPMEKMLRNTAKRQARVASIYLALHDRSNRRRKNGWVKDLRENVVKAVRKGVRLRFV